MSNPLVNHIYDRIIDYIQNRERDNSLRQSYADYMASSNFNNNEMANLVEVINAIAVQELRDDRSRATDEEIVRSVIIDVTDAHCGAYGYSDRQFTDSVDDRVYADIKRADERWSSMVERIKNSGRSGGRDTRGRDERSRGYGDDRGGGRGRSVFDRNSGRGFGDRNDYREEPRDRQASNSVFASRDVPVSTPGRRDTTQGSERRSPTSAFSQAPLRKPEPAREQRAQQTPERDYHQQERPRPEPVKAAPVVTEGPDMTKERPYDDFWMNGENWQLAHRSKFVWSWSARQQTRRTFNPNNEINFLVKGTDGTIREEFIQMTDDLIEEAHTIMAQRRPNRVRTAGRRVPGDEIFESNDLDVADLDVLKRTRIYVAKEAIKDLELANPVIAEQAIAVSTIEEAAVRVAGDATRTDADVTATNNIMTVQLAGDYESNTVLESIKAIGANEGDLLQMQKRLKSLRGTLAENVLSYLNKHFTQEVNDALRDQFGLANVSIDSFVDDFEDLLGCSTFKKLGQAYISQFLSRTRILLASMQYMTEESLREDYLECIDLLNVTDLDPEAYKEYRKNVVILFKPMAMVHIKLMSEELGITGNEVRVPLRTGPGADPALVEALTSLYMVGRRAAGAGRVYLITADNIMHELVAISGARDIVGIRAI